MNPGQLGAFFEANKPAVLGVAGLGVVGLALVNKRKRASGGGVALAQPAGTIPAAAVVPATSAGGTYDSSAYDVYSALQSELSPFLQAQAAQTSAGGSGLSAPAPVASSLFAPSFTGKYVGYSDGSVRELESDGSTYHLSLPEWSQVISHFGSTPNVVQAPGAPKAEYSNTANTLASIKS